MHSNILILRYKKKKKRKHEDQDVVDTLFVIFLILRSEHFSCAYH